ncbi:MAG: ASKHA domain-containing protein [Oscillospiraceae bacterium]|nr:ASKHA domain-containing protein [Oscillospiraceae bacterium]
MVSKIKIYKGGKLIRETESAPGETFHKCLADAGVIFDAPCGGYGKCGKCRIRLGSDGKESLACQTIISGDSDVHIPDDSEMIIAESSVVVSQSPKKALRSSLGVVVDIGTTTVVAHLTDIATSELLATASDGNAQRIFGADVVSRIQYCVENGHETLTQLIRKQIASLILQTCEASNRDAEDIELVSITGNTIMEHLAAGYSPASMGTAPYTPVSLFGCEFPSWEDLPIQKSAGIYYAPAISSYVGADITTGMLAAGLPDAEEPAVYVDIGTNGEIVLKTGGTYYCCATAAGPAFEGAEIAMGMAAIRGAISHVRWEDGLKTTVIGDRIPRGLCGSGLLDTLALLLDAGVVDETGRFRGADALDQSFAAYIDRIDGTNVFWLNTEGGGGVYISAIDIRKLQIAKAAIAAGIQALLRHTGVAEGHVKTFILAGGFGSFMDQLSAARIGLFPRRFLPVARSLGNTAGEGAALALCSDDARRALEDIRERSKYVELSTNPVFKKQFIAQMMFPAHITSGQK